MNRVYLIFLCLIFSAKAAFTLEQSIGAAIVDLYNQKLNFFDTFLSPNGIENLLQSQENVPLEAVKNLRRAWVPYTSLCGEIISWCTEVKNTLDVFGQIHESESRLAQNVLKELNEMKTSFDLIRTREVNRNPIENYQALITFEDGVLKYEVSRGRTPYNIESILWPILRKSKLEGTVIINTTMTTFSDKLQYARRMITESLAEISNADKDDFNKAHILNKCAPILDKLNTQNSSPPATTQTITHSHHDKLIFYKESCSRSLGCCHALCEVLLSKSTMSQLLKLYRNDELVAGLFNTLSRSAPPLCKNILQSYIRDSYLGWSYKATTMGIEQLIKLSTCLDANQFVQVTIIDL